MKNFTGQIVGYSYNGRRRKTAMWLGGLYDVDTKELLTATSMKDFIEMSKIIPTANFFFHGLAENQGRFVLYYLISQGYELIPQKHPVERLDSNFVIGTGKGFTVYHYLPDEQKHAIHNYYDSSFYLIGSLRAIGRTLGVEKGDYPKIPYGKKYEAKTSDYELLRTDCEILSEAMLRGHFVEAFENRIRSISQYATQTLFYGEEPKLHRIEEFEPTNVYSGYRGNYTEKRFTKWHGTAPSVKIPKDWNITSGRRSLGEFDELRKRRKMVKKARQFATEPSVVKQLDEADERLDKLSDLRRWQLLQEQRNKRSRKAYRTGYYLINDKVKGEWQNRVGVTIDCNSIYPYLYSRKNLPKDVVDVVNSLEEFEKNYGYEDYVYLVGIKGLKAKVKKGKVPTIRLRTDDELNVDQLDQLDIEYECPRRINYKNLHLTQPDYEYLMANYMVYHQTPTFYVMSIDRELMKKSKDFAETYYELKSKYREEGKLFEEVQSKRMLNSPTGYWGVKKHESVLNSFVNVSAFLTAYGRSMTANLINNIGLDYFCYTAVDSIHCFVPEEFVSDGEVDVDGLIEWFNSKDVAIGKDMGEWKIERLWKSAKFLHVNCYGEEELDGTWHSTVSGFKGVMPKEDFETGMVFTHEMTEEVTGGVLLLPKPFRLW